MLLASSGERPGVLLDILQHAGPPHSKELCCVRTRSVMSDSLPPYRPYPPGSSVLGILQASILSGLPFPPPGAIPNPGMEPTSPASPAVIGKFFSAEATPKNAQTTEQLHSHASKVMLKILQARLQQYVNCELPDVQAGFRKGRNQRSNCQHLLYHQKSKRVPGKCLFLLY